MNQVIGRWCSRWGGTHQSQGPRSQGVVARCHLDWDWERCIACLERSVSTACVCVLSLPRWMKKPRCGVPDHPHLSRRRRSKRYALTGQKWRQKHITYRCSDALSSSLALSPTPPPPRFCRRLSLRGSCCRWWVCERGESQVCGHQDQVLRACDPSPLGLPDDAVSPTSGWFVSCFDSYSFQEVGYGLFSNFPL